LADGILFFYSVNILSYVYINRLVCDETVTLLVCTTYFNQEREWFAVIIDSL